MPKYVFEVAATLPEGSALELNELRSISLGLEIALGVGLERYGKSTYQTAADAPFEHVVGPNADAIDLPGPA